MAAPGATTWQGMLAVPVRTNQPEVLAEDAAVQIRAPVER